ncbi:EF-hand calcium-binding domain-containing protein 2 [Biomphalaria pfeifferi]|uniref:EF-hand calcium-binding domain-containing protein 2 n=1 Tax=Biomphalaria pfeifferi TaxID=112525 RepID=A0AAD8F032_BIOPF|nr:EF-hand calcium-binding domain-containing protein 2 [Biomphalaria pfeifferi]
MDFKKAKNRKKSTKFGRRNTDIASRMSQDSTEAKFMKIQERIKASLGVYDPDGTGLVDNRYFKTLVYALHRVPNNNQMDDMFETIQEDKNAEQFFVDKFEKMMVRVMSTDRYKSSSAKELEAAFAVLDVDKKGYFTADEWIALLTSSGEIFTEDEIKETLKMTIDPETETFVPSTYIHNLLVDENTH